MNIDWKLLIDVRERRKKLALEAMLADRRAAEHSRLEAQRAEAARQQCVDAKAAHWHATRSEMSNRRFSVAQLCDASAWSGVLDSQIARQNDVVRDARATTNELERVLDSSRSALRRAAAGVEKAEQMQSRGAARRHRLEDARTDADAEVGATAAWVARRAR